MAKFFYVILSEIRKCDFFNNSPDPEVSKEGLKLFLAGFIASVIRSYKAENVTGTLERM
jgi:hypothetical protein